MIHLSPEGQAKLAEELKWRFNLPDNEIQDLIAKTIEYINNLQGILNTENLDEIKSIAQKLIRIS
jgi:hypothetical protein